jgi:hypothetical protein
MMTGSLIRTMLLRQWTAMQRTSGPDYPHDGTGNPAFAICNHVFGLPAMLVNPSDCRQTCGHDAI